MLDSVGRSSSSPAGFEFGGSTGSAPPPAARKGNRCGHDPRRPRLVPVGVPRPTDVFLAKAWDRIERLYTSRKNHKLWRQHFSPLLAPPPSGRRSARKQGGGADPQADYDFRRSELLEALVLLLRVLVARHDGRTMRVCLEAPDEDDQVVGLSQKFLVGACEISFDRVDRALGVLKSAGFELWRASRGKRPLRVPCQPREWVEEHRNERGILIPAHWRSWPAVRVLDALLFRALGLSVEHGLWRQRKAKEWKGARRDGPPSRTPSRSRRGVRSEPRTLADLITSSGVLQRPNIRTAGGGLATPHRQVLNDVADRLRAQAFAEIRSRLYRKLATENPDWTHEQLRAELLRLIE